MAHGHSAVASILVYREGSILSSVTVWWRPTGSGGAALGNGGLAHGSASSRSAAGQRQQRGLHPGVSPRTLPQGREETLRQSGQKVDERAARGKCGSSPVSIYWLCSPGTQSSSSMTSWSRPWTRTGEFHKLTPLQDFCCEEMDWKPVRLNGIGLFKC